MGSLCLRPKLNMIGVNISRINRYLLGALLLGGAALPATAAETFDGLRSCELSAAGGRLTASARCGEFQVAENPDAPEDRQIELAYAVLPARGGSPAPDPVFFLAGGPGQSARDALPLMDRALREVNLERDLIFLDQRGTGGSNPLDCSFEGLDDWLEQDFDEIDRQLRECHAEWDADVRFYTTGHAAADLEALRARYGFETINLIGGSYGTRLAQVYLREHADRVRSVVLDGVVPTRLKLGSEHALKLDKALEKLFAACADDPSCGDAFPGLPEAFRELVTRYRDTREDLIVTHPRSGVGTEIEFSRDVLASALRFLAYNPQTQALIPYLVHEAAATGDPSRLASQAMIVTDQMDDMIAIGLNFAVGCAEDWPDWPRDVDTADTLLGDAMLEFYDQVCSWWPAGEAPADFHQPFDRDVPVLALSGELDPVTPPEYGNEAASQYSDSLHLIGRGRGHIVSTDPCFAGIVAEFIADADHGDLDTDCMDYLGPEPFVLDLLGPAP